LYYFFANGFCFHMAHYFFSGYFICNCPVLFFNIYTILLSTKFIVNFDLSEYPFLFEGLFIFLLCLGVCGKLVAATYRQKNKEVIAWLSLCLLLIISIDIINGANWIGLNIHSVKMFVNRNVASSGIFNLYIGITWVLKSPFRSRGTLTWTSPIPFKVKSL